MSSERVNVAMLGAGFIGQAHSVAFREASLGRLRLARGSEFRRVGRSQPRLGRRSRSTLRLADVRVILGGTAGDRC